MEGNYWIGIDISKRQLDWQVNEAHNQPLLTGNVQNGPGGIARLLEGWSRQGICREEMIICFEHTGPYGLLLAAMLEEAGISYVMVAAAQVQLSLGIRRGKTDEIDAGRLAEYVRRFRDRLQPSRLPSKALLELRGWLLWRRSVRLAVSLPTNSLPATAVWYRAALTAAVAVATSPAAKMVTSIFTWLLGRQRSAPIPIISRSSSFT